MLSKSWTNEKRHKHNGNKSFKEVILWIDVECAGTTPETDALLEVGAVLTDMSGNEISSPWEKLFKVNHLSRVIEDTDQKVRNMHDISGLWLDLWDKSCVEYSEGDLELEEWLGSYLDKDTMVYFGGNSITLDRNFMRFYLPRSYSLISYRSIDVTSLSIAIQSNTRIPGFEKGNAHRALPDALDSVYEYRHYLSWLKFIETGQREMA